MVHGSILDAPSSMPHRAETSRAEQDKPPSAKRNPGPALALPASLIALSLAAALQHCNTATLSRHTGHVRQMAFWAWPSVFSDLVWPLDFTGQGYQGRLIDAQIREAGNAAFTSIANYMGYLHFHLDHLHT